MLVSSKQYKDWHKQASMELTCVDPCESISSVDIVFWGGNKRKFDLTNKAESVMDLLVDNGIITDDSWDYVPELSLKFLGIDKNNPRVIIYLNGD